MNLLRNATRFSSHSLTLLRSCSDRLRSDEAEEELEEGRRRMENSWQ